MPAGGAILGCGVIQPAKLSGSAPHNAKRHVRCVNLDFIKPPEPQPTAALLPDLGRGENLLGTTEELFEWLEPPLRAINSIVAKSLKSFQDQAENLGNIVATDHFPPLCPTPQCKPFWGIDGFAE